MNSVVRTAQGTPGVIMALMATVLMIAPGPLDAQTVTGVLVAAGSGDPIGGAAVQLMDPDDEPQAAVLTDREGRFTIHAPEPGPYRIVAAGMGYETGESELIPLEEGDPLEVTLMLPVAPVLLDGIEVEVEARPWMVEQPARLWPFFERRRWGQMAGLGQFLTRGDLEGLGGRISNLFQIQNLYMRMPDRSMERPCTDPIYYLDGMRLSGANRQTIDDFVGGVSDLEAIEIYRRASEIPGEFGGSDAHCGVVVFWTRRVP